MAFVAFALRRRPHLKVVVDGVPNENLLVNNVKDLALHHLKLGRCNA